MNLEYIGSFFCHQMPWVLEWAGLLALLLKYQVAEWWR